MNLCRSCRTDFASVKAFDGHRVGSHPYTFAEGLLLDPPVEDGRRCLDAVEMAAKGIEPDEQGRFSVTADAERARNHFSGRGVVAERLPEVELVV